MGRNTLPCTGETELLLGLGLDGYAADIDLHGLCQTELHGRNMGHHLRLLCNDNGVDIADLPAMAAENVGRFLQKQNAVGTFVFGISIGEMCADIGQACRTKQTVDDGMSTINFFE